jgi:hypothetical protein
MDTHSPEPSYILWERGLTISGNRDGYYAPFLKRERSNKGAIQKEGQGEND